MKPTPKVFARRLAPFRNELQRLNAERVIAPRSYHFVIAVRRAKEAESAAREVWEIIADNLKKACWSLGYVSAIDSTGRTIWLVDAHRGTVKRFVVLRKKN